LLERTTIRRPPEAVWVDWEAAAGGPMALPRIADVSFIYRGGDDEHLSDQGCLALEPAGVGDLETVLVAFACGCRARVLRKLLEIR
jgi:hypothetical protein